MQTILYCIVINGGDGSAYTEYYDSRELAEWVEEQELEGFAESTISELVIEHDSPIKIKKLKTPLKTYIELLDRVTGYSQSDDFLKKFFPDGLPEFKLDFEKLSGKSKYIKITHNDEVAGKIFVYDEESMERVLKQLRVNSD